MSVLYCNTTSYIYYCISPSKIHCNIKQRQTQENAKLSLQWCNDVENGGKNVEQLVRIERSSLTNIWRALCADCIPVEILLPTFIGVEIGFDKLSCPYRYGTCLLSTSQLYVCQTCVLSNSHSNTHEWGKQACLGSACCWWRQEKEEEIGEQSSLLALPRP